MSNDININSIDNVLNILLIAYLLYSIFSFVTRNPFSILYIMLFIYISVIIYTIYSFFRKSEILDENQISFIISDVSSKPKFNDDDVSSLETSDDLESDKKSKPEDKKLKKKSKKKSLKKEINETKNQIQELKDLINSKFENKTTYSSYPYSFFPYTYNYTSFSGFDQSETDVKPTSDDKEDEIVENEEENHNEDDNSEQILVDALNELINDNYEVVD
jgi:hypothetical protein